MSARRQEQFLSDAVWTRHLGQEWAAWGPCGASSHPVPLQNQSPAPLSLVPHRCGPPAPTYLSLGAHTTISGPELVSGRNLSVILVFCIQIPTSYWPIAEFYIYHSRPQTLGAFKCLTLWNAWSDTEVKYFLLVLLKGTDKCFLGFFLFYFFKTLLATHSLVPGWRIGAKKVQP